MKTFKNYIAIVTLLVGTLVAQAQQYPIRLTANAIPPNELSLSRYSQLTQEKLQLQIVLTDLLASNREVYIKLALYKGFSNTPMAQSSPSVNSQIINLLPGVLVTQSNIDLRHLFELPNLQGISTNAYYGVLPDGMYRYCFTAYDAVTNKQLSNTSCALVNIRKFAPPFLNLPANKAIIKELAGVQNMLFQWVPGGGVVPDLQYKFTLRQLWSTQHDVRSGFATGTPIYETTVTGPTLYYDMSKPVLEKGKRYAWQVQATSSLGEVFTNKGYSEIFAFTYIGNCTAPTFLTAQVDELNNANLRWQAAIGGVADQAYKILYRKKGETVWSEQYSYQPSATLPTLEPNTVYEYKIAKECEGLRGLADSSIESYMYSSVQEFSTPKAVTATQNTVYQCGVQPNIDLSNRAPYKFPLPANDVFMAGDFPVTVLEAQGGNGTYSGKGYTTIPYLAGARIKVVFRGITLNSDKRMIDGFLETSYNMEDTKVAVNLPDGNMRDMAMCDTPPEPEEEPVADVTPTPVNTTPAETPNAPVKPNTSINNPTPTTKGGNASTNNRGDAPTTEVTSTNPTGGQPSKNLPTNSDENNNDVKESKFEFESMIDPPILALKGSERAIIKTNYKNKDGENNLHLLIEFPKKEHDKIKLPYLDSDIDFNYDFYKRAGGKTLAISIINEKDSVICKSKTDFVIVGADENELTIIDEDNTKRKVKEGEKLYLVVKDESSLGTIKVAGKKIPIPSPLKNRFNNIILKSKGINKSFKGEVGFEENDPLVEIKKEGKDFYSKKVQKQITKKLYKGSYTVSSIIAETNDPANVIVVEEERKEYEIIPKKINEFITKTTKKIKEYSEKLKEFTGVDIKVKPKFELQGSQYNEEKSESPDLISKRKGKMDIGLEFSTGDLPVYGLPKNRITERINLEAGIYFNGKLNTKIAGEVYFKSPYELNKYSYENSTVKGDIAGELILKGGAQVNKKGNIGGEVWLNGTTEIGGTAEVSTNGKNIVIIFYIQPFQINLKLQGNIEIFGLNYESDQITYLIYEFDKYEKKYIYPLKF